MGLSARFDVMEIMEKRVKSRFSHRRDIVLELDAAGFEHPHSGVPSLLAAMLALPVRILLLWPFSGTCNAASAILSLISSALGALSTRH